MIKLGKLHIDPIEYGSQGNAILGIRDSGKSYTATFFAEQLFEAGIPFIAFDPIGIWRFLRIPGKGRGYPIVVAGGKDGDLPLSVASAPEIVRAAMQNGVSLVIDLFDINLSKADWRRIVAGCIRVLLHENQAHGLRHVFLEEAAEFIPQKPTDFIVYAEIEKMARMGGNSRLGYTLINQRSQEVAKAILELCENVFLHRQRGKNALENMDKWLAIAGATEQKNIIAALPEMPQGQCFAWIGGDTPQPPMLVKVPTKHSLHPDRRVMRGDQIAGAKPAIDVSAFVKDMRSGLVKFEEEAKANDPALLRAEIARLKKLIGAPTDPAALTKAREDGFDHGRNHMRSIIASTAAPLSNAIAAMADALERCKHVEHVLQQIADPPAEAKSPPPPVNRALSAPRNNTPRPPIVTTGAILPKGERAVLIAVAQHPNGVTRQQLTALTGYKRSTRDAYIQRLRERGHVEDGERITASHAGIAALGSNYEPLPTGDALQAHIMPRLPEGERNVLEIVIQHYPQAIDRTLIDAKTNYARSSRDAYLQRLLARELITTEGRGGVRASDMLFGQA